MDKRTLIYSGPFDAVEVPVNADAEITAVRGEPTEFPAEIAERLLEQDIWEEPGAKAKGRKADGPPDDGTDKED